MLRLPTDTPDLGATEGQATDDTDVSGRLGNGQPAAEAKKKKTGRPAGVKEKFPRSAEKLAAMTADAVIDAVFDGKAVKDAALTVLSVMRSRSEDVPAKVKLECAKLILDRRLGLAIRQDQQGEKTILLSADETASALEGLKEAEKLVSEEAVAGTESESTEPTEESGA